MKKILLVSTALLAISATAAFAGLDLAWNACNTNGGTLTTTFDCAGDGAGNPGAPSIMYGSWQIPVAQDSVVSLDGSIDLATQTNPMGSFWHFEGCNQNYDFSRTRPAAGCAGSFVMWSAANSDQGAAYLPPGALTVPPGGNRGRWVFTIFRPSANPLNVPAARNNFGFAFTFLMDGAIENAGGGGPGTCVGCPDGVTWSWNSASVGNIRTGAGSEAASYDITGPGLTTSCVMNGGPAPPCGVVPNRNRTWGQVKSLYR